MQSSSVMALRTLVMLVSLLTVPLAAVYGTGSWPRVQELIDQLRHTLAAKLDPARGESAAPTNDATLAPTAPLAGPPITPLTSVVPDTLASAPEPPAAAVAPPVPDPLPLPPKPPFWPDAPAAVSAPSSPAPAPRVDPQVQPAAYAAEATPLEPAAPPADAPDRMGWIRHRLETLGADRYRLETAGTNGEMFRFVCKMISPTNPNYVRYFEATSGEPLRAMQHVLDQVDAWMAKGDSSRR